MREEAVGAPGRALRSRLVGVAVQLAREASVAAGLGGHVDAREATLMAAMRGQWPSAEGDAVMVVLNSDRTGAEKIHVVACWLLWGMPPAVTFFEDGSTVQKSAGWGDDAVAATLARGVGFDRGSYLGNARHMLATARHSQRASS